MIVFIKNILKGIRKDKIQTFGLGMIIFLAVTLISTLYNVNMGTITAVKQTRKDGNQQDFMFLPGVNSSTDSIDNLSKKYNFKYDTRSYKNIEDKINGEDYYFRFLNPKTTINTPLVIDGSLPKNSSEIAINTNFAYANDYNLGDTVTVKNKIYNISAIVVVPDYISPIVKENSIVYNDKTEALIIPFEEEFKSISNPENIILSGKFTKDVNENTIKDMKNDLAFSFILFNESNFSINSINAKINMNKIIVLVSMVCLISIVVLMLILFLNKKINNDKYSLGVMKAHGFKSIKLALAYIVYPTVILIPSATIGYLTSLVLSPIFEKSFNYGFSLPQIAYTFNPLILGVFIGAPLIVLSYTTIICVCIKLRSKTLELLNDLDDAKVSKFTKTINKFKRSKKFLSTLKWNFAISNKKLILLCVFGAYCVGLQMILSINLYTMPEKMVEDEFKGRNYSYDLRLLDGVNGESLIQDNDEGYYNYQGNISSTLRDGSSKEVSIDTNIIGIDSNSKLLELYEGDKNINSNLDKGFIINEVLHAGQGLRVGDEITININNKDITGVIQGVNQFLSNNDVYTSEKFLSLNGIDTLEINGIFTNKIPSVDNAQIAAVTKLDELQYSFEKSTEMVKSAGVLQAVIGILLGCLIIGVTTNILVQDNRKNLTLMRAMGYTNKEINNSCLKIYTPFIILGFLFSIPNSFLIMNLMFNEVAKSASMSYPVKFNILSIIISLLVTIIVYYTTIAFYSTKLEKVSLNEIMQ